MKVKTLVLAAGTGALLCAGSASADFLGIDVVDFTNYLGNTGEGSVLPGNFGQTTGAHPLGALHQPYQDSGLRTFRLYALYSAPTMDLAVLGTSAGEGNHGQFTAKAGTFWHAPQEDAYGSPLPPRLIAPATPFPSPMHVADSYLTIGDFVNPTVAFAPNEGTFRAQTQNMGEGLDKFGYQDSGIFQGAGDQKAPILNPQGLVNDGYYRVLIAQLSLADAGDGAGLVGQFGFLGHLDADTGQPIQITGEVTSFSTNAVPAPGALALLGLAGLVGTRRRRAA